MIVVISSLGQKYDMELKKLGFEFIRSSNYYELCTDCEGFELIKPTINYLSLRYSIKEEIDDLFMTPWFRIYVYGAASPLIYNLALIMPHYGIVNDTLIIQTYSEMDMKNKVKKIIELIKDSDLQIYKINHKKDCTLIYVNLK